MPLDPAQRHQVERDALTAAWKAERLATCDEAVALLRKVADMERDDDGDVIIGTEADGHSDLLTRIAAFLAADPACRDQAGHADCALAATRGRFHRGDRRGYRLDGAYCQGRDVVCP